MLQQELCEIVSQFAIEIRQLKQRIQSDEMVAKDAELIVRLGIDELDLICQDYSVFSEFVSCLCLIIKSNNQTEESKHFALKMLRWLLVMDPDERQLKIAKKCFLMNLNINSFRITVIESAMERISNTNDLAPFLCLDPKIFGDCVLKHLTRLLPSTSNFSDEFIANLLIEHDGWHFKSLNIEIKRQLCLRVEECLHYCIMEYYREEWLIDLLSLNTTTLQSFSSKYGHDLFFLHSLTESVNNRAIFYGSARK